jgi:hypothetical protein
LWKGDRAARCERPFDLGLRIGVFDPAQPEALRIQAVRLGVLSAYELFNFFIFKHSVAMRLEASTHIAALPCDSSRRYVKQLIADALRDERDAAVIANLEAAAAKQCPRPRKRR